MKKVLPLAVAGVVAATLSFATIGAKAQTGEDDEDEAERGSHFGQPLRAAGADGGRDLQQRQSEHGMREQRSGNTRGTGQQNRPSRPCRSAGAQLPAVALTGERFHRRVCVQRLRREALGERVHEIPHPSSERAKKTVWRRRRRGAERAKDAAAPAFRVGEARKQRRDRELLNVAGVNAAEQRFGDEIDAGVAESPPEEARHTFVARPRVPRHERFHGEAHPRGRREQIVSGDAAPRRRDSQNRWGRQGMQSSPLEHERGARRRAGDHLRLEPDRAT